MTDDVNATERDGALPPKAEPPGAGSGLAAQGLGLAKRMGGFLARKAGEKIDDTRQRMAEPQLTANEQDTLRRYRAIREHLPADHLLGHPSLPAETILNRREQRAFLGAHNVPDLITRGEAAAERAEEARSQARREAHAAHVAAQEAAEAERRREAAELAAYRVRVLERHIAEIDAFYANILNTITISMGELRSVLPASAINQAGELAFEGSRKTSDKNWLGEAEDLTDMLGKAVYKGVRKGAANEAVGGASFQRALVSMTEQERAALRLADILRALDELSDQDVLKARAPIVWNRGECLITIDGRYGNDLRKREAAQQAIKTLISAFFGEPATGSETIKEQLRRVMEPSGSHPTIQQVLERYIVAGARWMLPAESATFVPKGPSPSTLRLGRFAGSEAEFLYDMKESLITVAAPGTGKSQGHVLRNLLYLEAPAVVLDVKGEMRDHSAAWRRDAVGPVHVFAPTAPDISLHYNPLDFISNDPDEAWDQARKLADLLVVPTTHHSGDSYFEDRARDMITTAVADVTLTAEPAKRNMTAVLDKLYLSGSAIDEWANHLKGLNVSALLRQGSALGGMPDKQREGIFDSARRQLEIWQSRAIERLTTTTTFSTETLRSENATLYLCVTLEDIKKYASVLRVIIGQTVQQLCRVEPEDDSRKVTFFLDELPRLGRMDVIEQALETGRGYGVRLWMFCQNTGQLETTYPNAAGMLKSCAVRAFMNPDEHTAHTLSHNLGTRESLLDATRRPLAEASQLAGPDFGDKVLVFSRSSHTARLEKVFAYADPVTAARMRHGREPPPIA